MTRNRPATQQSQARNLQTRERAVRAREKAAERREASARDLLDANQSLTLFSLDARKRAEAAAAASREQEEFLATVSHELRTPLTAVLGWAKLLSSAPMSAAESQHALDTIQRNGEALAQLIERLIDTSRIALGALHLAKTWVPLAPIVADAVDGIRPLAEQRKIELTATLLSGGDAASAFVLGDVSRLQQVVGNLLTNAIKFTPERGRVDVDLRQDADFFVLRVSDTGIGLAPELLSCIFDRFRQAAHSTTSESGLGLGLAIVRELVTAHGGAVEATSPGIGQGSTFTVRLPIAAPMATGVTQP